MELEHSGKLYLVSTPIGNLKDMYNAATVVFVGGSLVPKGGQNPIEGARFSKPIIFGPYMSNFQEIAQMFLNADAALMVKDEDELFEVFDTLLKNERERVILGRNAGRIVSENSGTIDKTVEELTILMSKMGEQASTGG